MKRILMILLLLAGLLPLWCGLSNAEPKGTLIVADATGVPDTWDPYKIYGTEMKSIFRQIYDLLIDRDPNGKLIPGIAKSWELFDDTIWQIKLQEGIKFHNGDEVTAEDVEFSIKRILDPKVKSPRRRDFDFIDRVEVINKYTVNIITKEPYALLPDRLFQFSIILPARVFQQESAEEFFNNPIGVGPFKFAKWDKEGIILEANENYWKGSPKVKRVIFKFISGKKERIERLLNKDLDIVSNIMPQYTLKLRKDKRIKLIKKPVIQFFNAILDTFGKKAFADRRVRQALNYATDVDKLIRYVQKGNGRRLATFSMPEEFGYNPNLKPYPFDIEKARTLLAQAGYPNGFKVKVLTTDDCKELAKALASQWRKLGIETELDVRSRTEAISIWINKKIPFDIFTVDPTDLLLDASYQMVVHLDPQHPISRFHDDRVIKLLYKSNETMDKEKRSALLQKIQEIVYEEAPVVFLYQNIGLYGVGADVIGFVPYADTILRLYNVSVNRR